MAIVKWDLKLEGANGEWTSAVMVHTDKPDQLLKSKHGIGVKYTVGRMNAKDDAVPFEGKLYESGCGHTVVGQGAGPLSEHLLKNILDGGKAVAVADSPEVQQAAEGKKLPKEAVAFVGKCHSCGQQLAIIAGKAENGYDLATLVTLD